MSGNLSVPNTFGSASGNVPASQLDANWAAVVNYVNPREITIGTVGARPAAGTAGRWYFATDVNGGTLYADTGTAWQTLTPGNTVLSGASVIAGQSGPTAITAGTTRFFMLGFIDAVSATVEIIVPVAGTVSTLYVVMNTSPGGTETVTVTVMQNGGASSVTTTMTGAASTGTDLTHSFALAAGDRLSFRAVVSGAALAPIIAASVVLQP